MKGKKHMQYKKGESEDWSLVRVGVVVDMFGNIVDFGRMELGDRSVGEQG